MKNEFKKTIYKIEKKYKDKDFEYKRGNVKSMLGRKIDVYIDTIGQTIEEYLVNFEFFIDIMKEYGFKLSPLESHKVPKKTYDILESKTTYMDGIGGLNKSVKNYQHINQRTIFIKKAKPTD